MTTMVSRRPSFHSNLWSRSQSPSISVGCATAIALLSSDFYFHGMAIASLMTAFTFPFAFPIGIEWDCVIG
jgi:hypothetical protein